jgi:di/tricarboxylate transporter
MENLTLTTDMVVVLALLALTIVLFVSEVVRVDVAAVSVMVLLGLLSLVPGLGGITDPDRLFAGFASNAVISIIAVMIIGAGLDKTGVMHRVATFIMRVGGTTEKRIIPIISGTVGMISSFMQNVGAAALFLPVVSRISARPNIPMSRLLMPMGFCAILGGTITMVGSSPLILLNDLILPQGMEPFDLFDVTPIGLALLASAIVYFVVLGPFVLPSAQSKSGGGESPAEYFRRVYGMDYEIREVRIGNDSSLVGMSVAEAENRYGVAFIGSYSNDDLRIGPWGGYAFEAGVYLAVLGSPDAISRFLDATGARPRRELKVFANAMAPAKSGIAEVVIAPGSRLVGKTVTDVAMRRTYGLSVLRLHRGEEPIGEGLRDVPLRTADTLVVHCDWESLARLEGDRDFVIVTSDYPRERLRPTKVPYALGFLGIALGMILFTDLPLSVALLTGALGMILTGTIDIDDAYRAVSWKTVFLLASLIPLGAAVETTPMSKKHPVVVVTGSSGAGTTTVKRAFEHIFTREKLSAAVIEGDSMHSLGRVEFKEAMKKAEAAGNHSFSHFGPEANDFEGLANMFKVYGETGAGKKRYYIHSDEEAAAQCPPGHQPEAGRVHPLGRHARQHRHPVLRRSARPGQDRQGRHAQVRRSRRRRGAGGQPGMDPEDSPRCRRAWLFRRSHRRYHPAPHAGLRELRDAAVLADRHQLPARAAGRYLQPVHRARHPDAGRKPGGGAFP